MLTPESSRISLNDSSISVHILNNNVVNIGEISDKKRILMKMERVMVRKSLVEFIVCMRKRVKGYRIMKKIEDIVRNQVKLQLIRAERIYLYKWLKINSKESYKF